MATILRESYYTARKKYCCDACRYIFQFGTFSELQLTDNEKISVEKAKNNNWRIMPGEKYFYQVLICDGFQTFKAIPEIINICFKYKLFQEA